MRVTAAALLALVLALPAWGADPRRATLKLKDLTPLTVEGRGFGARERVVLSVSVLGAQRVRTVAANREGRFASRFALRLGVCAELTVRARGAQGHRAILQVEPDCDSD